MERSSFPNTLDDLARLSLNEERPHQERVSLRESRTFGPPEEVLNTRGGWDSSQFESREKTFVEEGSEKEETVSISPWVANEIVKFLDSRPSLIGNREFIAFKLKDKLDAVQNRQSDFITVDGEMALLLCAISDLLSFKLSDARIREEFAALKINTAHLSMHAMRFPSRRYEFTPISSQDVEILRDVAQQVLGPDGIELRNKVIRIFDAEVRQPERLVFPTIDEVAALERIVARNPHFSGNVLAQDLVKKLMSASGRHVGIPLTSHEAQLITQASDFDTRGVLDVLAARARYYAYWGRDERTFSKEDAQKLNRLASKIPQEKHLAAQIQSLTSDYAH